MAWSAVKVKVNGGEVAGQLHSSGNLVSIPFVEGAEDLSSITISGKGYTVERVVNVGGRDESLDVFVSANAPKSAKSKKETADNEGENPEN